MSLLCTGTIGIDTVRAPTGKADKVLGGSCTYFAAAASYYTRVRIVAAVGGDWPAKHRATLETFEDVDLRGLEVRPKSKTFAWGGQYAQNMDNRQTLFTELGVLAEPPPAVPEKFKDSTHVFLANTHPGVQLALLEQFPDRVLAVADTMDLWIKTARPELETLLGRVDGLVLNYDEAEQFSQVRNPVTAARLMLDKFGPGAAMSPKGKPAKAPKRRHAGLRFIVVKKGEHGAILVHRKGVAALPAYPSEAVVDPTGAGDSFAGGMMGSIVSMGKKLGKDPASFEVVRAAMAHGTVMASFVIEAFSLGRLLTLRRREVKSRLQEFERIVRVG
ncbi:MAG: sugar kinase [Planctomyces sp.]|nr:sugar kinase [Planctomyces sp.]MBA4039957.1 sugar kinase [Planctomyces sp.]MBA4120741.1 sugar kinase [Isosphaera sp.]